MVLLRAAGLEIPVWQIQIGGPGVQDPVPGFRCDRGGGDFGRGGEILRRDAAGDGVSQYDRTDLPLTPCEGGAQQLPEGRKGTVSRLRSDRTFRPRRLNWRRGRWLMRAWVFPPKRFPWQHLQWPLFWYERRRIRKMLPRPFPDLPERLPPGFDCC